MICAAILSPIVKLVRTVVQIVREIVRTICEWVSKIVTTVKTVVEEVCEWVQSKICKNLPWPLNKLCNWVSKLVCKTITTILTVVETVWEWICREVVERIIDFIEVIVEYVIYILKWVCWIIDWIIRGPALLLCLLGVEPRRYLGVCAKILADDAGNPAIPLTTVQQMLRDAAEIFRRCNIDMVVCSIEIVRKPEYLDSTTCGFSGMFKRFFTWFSANECSCCSNVTVYFVRDIIDASGCAYPGTNWVTVDAGGRGCTVVQEIGHLADLWGHSDSPGNVMANPCGNAITRTQCCMIRTSRFVKAIPPCDTARPSPGADPRDP